MMKIIKLSVIAIAISSLCYLTVTPVEGMSKLNSTEMSTPDSDTQQPLLKKWMLSHYEVFGTDYQPEEVEKNDYIHFLEDHTFTSVSEGVFEKGSYQLTAQTIILTNDQEEGALKLIIKKLSESKLEVVIDDPSDEDAKYVTIHFKN